MEKTDVFLISFISVLILGICFIGYIQYSDFYHDDALISLRYCLNLINGDGLVWNPSERVEGYSNFLFVILVSILGISGIELILASQIAGVLSFIGLNLFIGCFLFRRYYRLKRSNYLPFITVIFTATSFPLIIWSLGGLEGVFFTFLCTIGMWRFMETMDGKYNQAVSTGILFALTGMARVDGILFFFIACLFYIISVLLRKMNNFRYLIWFITTSTILYGGYFLWRLSYYGQFMPNTYYVKSGYDFDRIVCGVYYVMEFFISAPYILPLMILGLIYSMFKKHWHHKMSYLMINIIIYILYVIYHGGDHMPAFRLLLPIIPSSALIIYFALEPLQQYIGKNRIIPLCGLLIILTALQVIKPSRTVATAKDLDSAAFVGAIIGSYVAGAWPSGSLIALNTAGSTPYFAPDHRYIDMLGLNDTTIARRDIKIKKLVLQNIPGHKKGDGEYVLSRKPDYIILGGAEGSTADHPWFLSDYEISISEDFKNNYRMKIIDISVNHIDDYDRCLTTQSGTLTFIYYERMK